MEALGQSSHCAGNGKEETSQCPKSGLTLLTQAALRKVLDILYLIQ
jgi:hypothetical protein